MKIHVRDMTGLVLDYAVAKARKLTFDVDDSEWCGFEIMRLYNAGDHIERMSFNPSRNAADGLWVVKELLNFYHMQITNDSTHLLHDITIKCSRERRRRSPCFYVTYKGNDVVQAASRCYVAIKHGSQMEIPDVYVKHQMESDLFRENVRQQMDDDRGKKKP